MRNEPLSDLAAEAFLALRQRFFVDRTTPLPYDLRGKGATQDDPLDEYIHEILVESLPADASAVKAPGALTNPDMVVLRPAFVEQSYRAELSSDSGRIVGLEVKKLEPTAAGNIPRLSGMDYNTTPPCGTIQVYDRAGTALNIPGFYLFMLQVSEDGADRYAIRSLVMCDGAILNDDFDYYLSIVGEREKVIGVGSYGDGANRQRPMLIFANPLSCRELASTPTLVHRRADVEASTPNLRQAGVLTRRMKDGQARKFYCYRHETDVEHEAGTFQIDEPFVVAKRTAVTQARGRFILPVLPRSGEPGAQAAAAQAVEPE